MPAAATGETVDIRDLDEAMHRLEAQDPRKSRAVELHYFGGLPYDEIAEAEGVSASSVKRDLQFARAWLREQLG